MLETSWPGVFRKHLLRALPVEKIATHFTPGWGRPSKNLQVMLGSLILQQLFDLTDAKTVEAVAFNIAWHYALDIHSEEEALVCERTLRNYRRLVMDNDLAQELFASLTDTLITAYNVDTGNQRIDSTRIQSAMRTLSRLVIVVETVSKFLRELERKQPDLYQRVDGEIIRLYVARTGAGCFELAKPSEATRRLPEAGATLARLVRDFAGSAATSLDSYQLMRRVQHEHFQVREEQQQLVVEVKHPKEVPSDSVQNPADPDASYNTARGQGFMLQVMESYHQHDPDDPDDEGENLTNAPNLITHIEVHQMIRHDQDALPIALGSLGVRGHKPERVLGDSHYGANHTLQESRDQGVEVIARAAPPRGHRQGRFTLEDFELDEDGVVLECPQGRVPVASSKSSERIEVRFDQEICQACSLRESCPGFGADRRDPDRWQYTPKRVRQREYRLEQRSDAWQQKYRWRAGIEGTISRLKHQLNLALLRVRGLKAVSYAAFLRALGMNILRVAGFTCRLAFTRAGPWELRPGGWPCSSTFCRPINIRQ